MERGIVELRNNLRSARRAAAGGRGRVGVDLVESYDQVREMFGHYGQVTEAWFGERMIAVEFMRAEDALEALRCWREGGEIENVLVDTVYKRGSLSENGIGNKRGQNKRPLGTNQTSRRSGNCMSENVQERNETFSRRDVGQDEHDSFKSSVSTHHASKRSSIDKLEKSKTEIDAGLTQNDRREDEQTVSSGDPFERLENAQAKQETRSINTGRRRRQERLSSDSSSSTSSSSSDSSSCRSRSRERRRRKGSRSGRRNSKDRSRRSRSRRIRHRRYRRSSSESSSGSSEARRERKRRRKGGGSRKDRRYRYRSRSRSRSFSRRRDREHRNDEKRRRMEYRSRSSRDHR